MIVIIFIILIIVIITSLRFHFESPESKGRQGESNVSFALNLIDFAGYKGKVLRNVYIPRKSGGTSEIDVLFITAKGILVIESKNYAGYIFGNESQRNWTVTLYAGKNWFGGSNVEKHHFYNPIRQNKTHIKALKSYLNMDVRTFSVIDFADKCELKEISYSSPETYVCQNSRLKNLVRHIWNNYEDVLSDKQIDAIFEKLQPLAYVDQKQKEEHIQRINAKINNISVCPECGGRLVIRTAKTGTNAGRQFYGCSNYPKCKFTRNI